MKLPCAVTRDLLPLYAEKMVERETEQYIDEHLADCPECRQRLAEIEQGTMTPVEAAMPLQALKKEIRKRRWYAAAVAALCVFVAVYAYFCRANDTRLVPWEDGLVEVEGIEERPREDIYGADLYDEASGSSLEALLDDRGSPETSDSDRQVLVLRVDSRINGVEESVFEDEDGRTLILQAWSSKQFSRGGAGEYSEMILYPVPDRLIYDDGTEQRLLWGEALNGGAEVLPRLALAYYALIAAALAALFGLLWLLLRRRAQGRIARQLFFAPVSYLIAQFLIKDVRTASFFLERDLFSILLIAAAQYALLTLAWQIWLKRRDDPARTP